MHALSTGAVAWYIHPTRRPLSNGRLPVASLRIQSTRRLSPVEHAVVCNLGTAIFTAIFSYPHLCRGLRVVERHNVSWAREFTDQTRPWNGRRFMRLTIVASWLKTFVSNLGISSASPYQVAATMNPAVGLLETT